MAKFLSFNFSALIQFPATRGVHSIILFRQADGAGSGIGSMIMFQPEPGADGFDGKLRPGRPSAARAGSPRHTTTSTPGLIQQGPEVVHTLSMMHKKLSIGSRPLVGLDSACPSVLGNQ